MRPKSLTFDFLEEKTEIDHVNGKLAEVPPAEIHLVDLCQFVFYIFVSCSANSWSKFKFLQFLCRSRISLGQAGHGPKFNRNILWAFTSQISKIEIKIVSRYPVVCT